MSTMPATVQAIATIKNAERPLRNPPRIESHKAAITATKKQKDDAEAAHDVVKAELKSLFPGNGYIQVPAGKVSFIRGVRKAHVWHVGESTV